MKMPTWLNKVGSVVGAILLAIVGVLLYGWRRKREGVAEGEAKGRAVERRKKVREQVETGDGGGLYRDLAKRGRK